MVENRSDTFEIGDDLEVHRLGLGAMEFCGDDVLGPPDDEASARRVLKRAVDIGVDFVDTADAYGPGVSERLIGQTLPDRDDVVVATKAGLLRNRRGEWIRHAHPDYIRNQVLCSLDRLQTETIDLYQLHRPDPNVPFEDAVGTFAELQDDGLVRHVGLSNVTIGQLERAREIAEIATVRNRFNIVDRQHEPVLEACEDYGIGFIPWDPLGGDLGESEDAIDSVATDHGATRMQIALAWLLEYSPVTLPIPESATVDHLLECVGASRIDLTDEERTLLD